MIEHIEHPHESAVDLARFVVSLQQISVTEWSHPTPTSDRGAPLWKRDTAVREAIASLRGVIDSTGATEAWEAAVAAPEWGNAPVWVHGDLHSGNLLAARGRLSAVIDFGLLGVGDPARDAMAAWTFLSSATRDAFRAAPSRLATIAPHLDAALATGDPARCVRAALAAARQAALACGLVQVAPDVRLTEANLGKLDALVSALDDEYFSLQEQSDRRGPNTDDLVPFARARAASAAAFALGGEAREAVYEAILATVDAPGITQTVQQVLLEDG